MSIPLAALSPSPLTVQCAVYAHKAVWKLDVAPRKGGVAHSVTIAVSYWVIKENQQLPSSVVADDSNTSAKGKSGICNEKTRLMLSIPFTAI